MKDTETERIDTLVRMIDHNVNDVGRILSQQASSIDSSMFVLSQQEIVALALRSLDSSMKNMGLQPSQIFLYKNNRLFSLLSGK